MNRQALVTLEEARARIATGASLLVAGAEHLLDRLPRGTWIGGTIPYFVGERGGCHTESELFLTELDGALGLPRIQLYDAETLPRIATDAPENGLSFVIIPAGSDLHRQYAEEAPSFADMFLKPVVGWVAGVGLDQLGSVAPKVFDGSSGTKHADRAVVMHLELPPEKLARIDIVNIFSQGEGDAISFPETGFTVGECIVNGERRSFGAYLAERGVDTRLPLVANYSGAMVNTSIQQVDPDTGTVTCYAPVFEGLEYRIASPVSDYAGSFAAAIPREAADNVFACNCILNYLYGELEGKPTGDVHGPMTFGEIAYQLLNQTLVYVTIQDLGQAA